MLTRSIFYLVFLPACLWFGVAPISAGETKKIYSFDELWSLVEATSPELQAIRAEAAAFRVGSDRASRHWYPVFYGEARAFTTNDPTTSFFSILGQRRVETGDFSPANLNEPGFGLFERGTLGVDLPIFEGGGSLAKARAALKMSEAKEWEGKAEALKLRASLAGIFAQLLSYGEEQKQIEDLAQTLEGVLKNYHLGAKSNPVGNSGLLGLQNLRNRLKVMLLQIETQKKSLKEEGISLVQELPFDWEPRAASYEDFVSQAFGQSKSAEGISAAVHSAVAAAEALENQKSLERSQMLPKVGLISEANLYRGDRQTSTAYTAGVYLQWNIFRASQIGALSQAESMAFAARSRASAARQKALSETRSQRESIQNTEKALRLMKESLSLLSQQTKNSEVLFRNGNINALQLVEVLSRRADFLSQLQQMQTQLSSAYASLAINGDFHEN